MYVSISIKCVNRHYKHFWCYYRHRHHNWHLPSPQSSGWTLIERIFQTITYFSSPQKLFYNSSKVMDDSVMCLPFLVCLAFLSVRITHFPSQHGSEGYIAHIFGLRSTGHTVLQHFFCCLRLSSYGEINPQQTPMNLSESLSAWAPLNLSIKTSVQMKWESLIFWPIGFCWALA